MHPQLHVFGLTLQAYSTMAAIAALTGAAMVWFPLKKCGFTAKQAFLTLLAMCAAFLLGARLWNVAVNYSSYGPSRPWYVLRMIGLSLYGGILGAFLVLLAAVRYLHLDLLSVLDAFTVPSGAAFCISRVGCFLNGCCTGLRTNLPWGLVFPKSIEGKEVPFMTLRAQPVHPTQLYELALALIGIPVCLHLVRRLKLGPGGRFLCYSVWFSAARLAVLPLRSLPYPPAVKTLAYPALYLGLMTAGVWLIMKTNPKNAQSETETDV